jgi:hypothetical protein
MVGGSGPVHFNMSYARNGTVCSGPERTKETRLNVNGHALLCQTPLRSGCDDTHISINHAFSRFCPPTARQSSSIGAVIMFMSSIVSSRLLAQRLSIFILLAAVGSSFVVTYSLADANDVWSFVGVAVVVTVALQIGYLIGSFVAAKWAGRLRRGVVFAVPLLVCAATIVLTTVVLSIIDTVMEVKHLVMGYLLPATLAAIYYGSTFAVLTSVASGVAAAYFLLPPKFSFQIEDALNCAELGFFMLLALIASKTIAAVARGDAFERRNRSSRRPSDRRRMFLPRLKGPT